MQVPLFWQTPAAQSEIGKEQLGPVKSGRHSQIKLELPLIQECVPNSSQGKGVQKSMFVSQRVPVQPMKQLHVKSEPFPIHVPLLQLTISHISKTGVGVGLGISMELELMKLVLVILTHSNTPLLNSKHCWLA